MSPKMNLVHCNFCIKKKKKKKCVTLKECHHCLPKGTLHIGTTVFSHKDHLYSTSKENYYKVKIILSNSLK